METILVPLDGSVLSEAALPVAAATAARAGARIVLASVHEPVRRRGTDGRGSLGDAQLDAAERGARESGLAAARRRVGELAPGVDVAAMMLDGKAGHALAAHVTQVGADLVVLTSHGRGGASDAWLGSVTDALVRRLRVPVLVLRGGADAGPGAAGGDFRRVLVPFDGTSASEDAVDAAAAVAGTQGVTYTLLRVAQPLHPLLQAVGTEREVERDTVEQRALAQREVEEAELRLRARGYTVSGCVRMDLQPARAILATAREMHADLIAIATHGRGPLGRFMLGSVADKVVRGASVPVLLRRRIDSEGRCADTASESAANVTWVGGVPVSAGAAVPANWVT